MAATGKVFHGARAIVSMNLTRNPNIPGTNVPPTTNTDGLTVIGVFTDVSWSMNYTATPIDILGRFSPTDITYTGASAVSGSASGWEVINNQPMQMGLIPSLDQLLADPTVQMEITDRQDPTYVFVRLHNLKVTSLDSGIANKSTSQFRISFIGTTIDEGGIVNFENGVPTLLG